jgi:hypothetical protein
MLVDELLQCGVVAVEEFSGTDWWIGNKVRVEQVHGEGMNVELLPATALDARSARDNWQLRTGECSCDE